MNYSANKMAAKHCLSAQCIVVDNASLRKYENVWIGTLLTNLGGLNTSHDYSQQ
jgi:hypothetical protein